MEDKLIVELYWQRNEEAITLTSGKYGAYCTAIAQNILHNAQDVQECVNDTWLGAWNSMPPQKPGRLRLFLAKITRNLAFNRYNMRTAQKRGGGECALVLDELAQCVADNNHVEGEVEAKELSRLINEFVGSLPEREGNIFIRRYFFCEKIALIAKRYGMSENSVMVTLSRTRQKLRERLIREGYCD